MSYGADVPDIFRRCAALIHKILQGTKPSDLAGRAADEV